MNYTTEKILEESTETLRPFMALIAYSTKNGRDPYIESHNINEKGEMLAGSPLTLQCITELVGSFSQEQIDMPHGRIPDNMLYFDTRIGYQKYIWYNPPQKRMMYFSKALKIPNREYCIPGIIYVVRGDSLNLYAFKGQKPKDKLYKAPFFNTTNGSVCLENANIEYPENPSFNDFIAYWEKKFWLTEFTHLGGSCNPTKDILTIVTKNSQKEFDNKQLLEMNNKLKDLLR